MDEKKVVLHLAHHFDSAHKLLNYAGKCKNVHGHRWEVKVSISGVPDSFTGMLCDFGEIKKVIDNFDHCYLNDKIVQPTAENLVVFLGNEIQDHLDLMENKPKVIKVVLFESPEASVEATWNC